MTMTTFPILRSFLSQSMNFNHLTIGGFKMESRRILLRSLIILVFLLNIAPCAYSAQVPQDTETSDTPVPEDPNKLLANNVDVEPLNYTLGPDDSIQIDVRRHPEFSGEYTINSEGKIQYKFVGDVPISGFTKEETKEKLTSILSKFIIEPEIDVTILQYRSKVIYIVGEVGAPGKYYMRADSVSVRDAVVQAGLPTVAASMRKTRLIRPDKHGNPKQQTVDLYKLLYEGNLKLDRDMLPGDILYVPSTLFAKIGRVLHPIAAPISSATTIERAATGGI